MKDQFAQLLLLTLLSSTAYASPQPLALIYKGEGACDPVLDGHDPGDYLGCSEAVAEIARRAGFQTRFIGPTDLPANPTPLQVAAIFKTAKLWIQPGGAAVNAYQAMSPGLVRSLKSFVSGGGGYVGFCAGAFMATSQIGTSGETGLGIFPGSTAVLKYKRARSDVNYAYLDSSWNGKQRAIFFEGGPYLYGQGSGVEVTALFDSGATLAARTFYGKGKVYITGGHPEAAADWPKKDLIDPDGLDHDLAAEMMRWASAI